MKICVVLLLLVVYVSADCGCLKCSKHLQGVDILGPAGFPVKVIFRRPKPSGCGCGCSCCCGCEAPSESPPGKVKEVHDIGIPGSQYSAIVQLPRLELPTPRLPLKTLKYRTDTILIQKPKTATPNLPASVIDPTSLTTTDILNWLRNLQLAHQLAAKQEEQKIPPALPQVPVGTVPCTEYQRYEGNVPPKIHNLCCSCQRAKRNLCLHDNTFKSPNSNKASSLYNIRCKRDLAKRGYNFLRNIIPQYVREPLHHSVQAANYLQQSKPKSTIQQKLNDLKLTKSQTHYSLPQRDNILDQPFKSFNKQRGLNSIQQPKLSKNSFLDQNLDHGAPYPYHLKRLQSRPKDYSTATFGSTAKSQKFSLSNRENTLENRKLSTLGRISPSYDTLGPSLDNTYKFFVQKHDSQRSPILTPKLAHRLEKNEVPDEQSLLKKLKRLNNNPYSSNLEDQATAFVQKLLKPEESIKRSKRSNEDHLKDHTRKKRTIILGSDEINLPPHYEVEMISVEDDSEENQPEEIESFEKFEEEEDPIVGVSPFTRGLAPARKFYSSLPILQPKPEVILGKNVIQKAVREELQAHHKKVENEKKLKEMKENLKRKKQQPFGVPQNPIFALLTAPVKFLKHFHDLNRGVHPVMSTIPKLIYTTKKVFKDLGRDFQRNCMDLASNVIGDFDHIHPSVIEQIVEPNGRRYRRDVLAAIVKECMNENKNKIKNSTEESQEENKNKIVKEVKATRPENKVSSNIKIDKEKQTNKPESSLKPDKEADKKYLQKEDSRANGSKNIPNNHKVNNSASSTNVDAKSQAEMEQTVATNKISPKFKRNHFAPDYDLVFKNSKEVTNFREVPDECVRKKRYVVRVVGDDEIQDQVEDYLTQKFEDQYDNYNPLQNYYEKVNGFLNKLFTTHQPLCQVGGECYYHRTAPAKESYENPKEYLESFEDSFEEKPAKKKILIKKMKPKIIIDNKGRPFMEVNGYKRPLLMRGKKLGMGGGSSEETGNKIAALIARAKEDSEIVGNTHKDVIPHQIVKERISSLLEEIDQLVHLNADNYDEIFDDLIKIEHIKISIEQDWKRLLINDKVNDISAKIGLFSKFKELQQVKDSAVKKIALALKKNDNEFVRCQLVNSLVRLQKLQCLITSVVEDFEQHLKMKTSFNTKKEIKYVDYLADLKFAFAKTRNDLVKMLCKDRDSEGLRYMEMLHSLKKLLTSADGNPEKIDRAAQLLWEMKNLEKLQIETIKDMNKKLARNFKIRKELKILFDLQRRFEDCHKELSEFLGGVGAKSRSNVIGQKKDIKEIIAEVKKRHEEMFQKAKERNHILVKRGFQNCQRYK